MRSVLDEYAKAAGAAPETAPAVLTTRLYIEQTFGAWRIVGGLSELATALYERCLKRGVSFRFDTEVTSVTSGAVTLANGEKLTTDVIVAAVDAHVLARLTRRKPAVSAAGYSPSSLSMKLKLGGSEARELPYETVIFGAAGTEAQPHEPTIRVQVAPEQPDEWIVHADVREGWDAERIRKTVAERLDVRLDALDVREVFTPADRERLTGTPGGSVNGPAIDSLTTAILRSPTVQPIKGLLHIGGSSRPGPGIAFEALSAWNAAEVLKPTRV